MTVAICYKCGSIKHGAFNPCRECGALPREKDDLALSLALTDHYFDRATLEKMVNSIKAGIKPDLAPETRANMNAAIDQMARMLPQAARSEQKSVQKVISKKRPWWKFWGR